MVEESPSPSRWGFRSFFFGSAPVLPPQPAVAKVGAGLLLRDARGDCLLLLRRSLNNDMTWGLPGGNAETVDGAAPAQGRAERGPLTCRETPRPAADLHATALREAQEELGGLPPLRVAGSYLTTRGKARGTRRERKRGGGSRAAGPY